MIIILMNNFRIKPSSSHPPRQSKTPNPNTEEFFPFSNKKLKVSGWEEDSLSIKRFKSSAHISRRNYEFIPNLKALKIDNQKVAIVKSARNQYNIFVQSPEKKKRNNMECINGVKTEDGRQGDIFLNTKLVGVNKLSANRSSLVFGSRYGRTGDFTSTYSTVVPLQVSGQAKCLSPSRSGTRNKSSNPDDKIIML